MAKFKFRLHTLLRLRLAERDRRRTELAQAYQADAVTRKHQEQLAKDLFDLIQKNRQAAAPGTVNVDRLLAAGRYEFLLRARQKQLQNQRQVVAAEIRRRQQVLVDANREVRVLEKLREKQAQRHREQENRREIKQLDEAAQLGMIREGVL